MYGLFERTLCRHFTRALSSSGPVWTSLPPTFRGRRQRWTPGRNSVFRVRSDDVASSLSRFAPGHSLARAASVARQGSPGRLRGSAVSSTSVVARHPSHRIPRLRRFGGVAQDAPPRSTGPLRFTSVSHKRTRDLEVLCGLTSVRARRRDSGMFRFSSWYCPYRALPLVSRFGGIRQARRNRARFRSTASAATRALVHREGSWLVRFGARCQNPLAMATKTCGFSTSVAWLWLRTPRSRCHFGGVQNLGSI